jgi:hypothetical protein
MVDRFSELQDVVARAIRTRGRKTSHTGVFIVGRLHYEGPAYPNQLYRELKGFLSEVDESLVPTDDDATRKYVWALEELDVIREATLELWLDDQLMREDILTPKHLNSDEDFSDLSFSELAELPFSRNYYVLNDDVDLSWLDATDEQIIASLQGFQSADPSGLDEFMRDAAGIPESIIAPYRVEWGSSSPR